MKNSIVLKVGGSILYDHLLNLNFELFKRIKKWYLKAKNEYETIVLVTGGGGISRNVQQKVSEVISEEDSLHSIAMSLTQTNATILASYLEDKEIFVPEKLGDAYEFLLSSGNKYMVSGGLKVGWSTDMDAAIFADVLNIDRVYKISNIDAIYDKDPKEFFEAKAIRDMKWKEYFKMFNILPGQTHKPNAHIPVDAHCAIYCEKKGLSYHITGGKLLEEIEEIKNILKEGTFLHP
ncbi:MAG: hypothetical protein ACOX0X_01050 [Candidatus Dojkabacteria bacterium]|jgi:predicted uridylate kinase